MRISIIIPAHNQVKHTAGCLETVLTDLGDDDEVVLVDDDSADATPVLAGWPGVRYERLGQRSGFAAAVNHGAAVARGDFLLLLNNDTIPQPGWLESMHAAMRQPTVGVVGARLIYPGTNLIQHAGMVFGADCLPYHIYRHHDANCPHVRRRRPFASLTGACLLVRRELFAELGGLDEGYRNGYEDVDLCLQSGARGYQCLYEPEAVVLHYEGLTVGRFDQVQANLQRFRRKWAGQVVQDDLAVLRADGFAPDGPTAAVEMIAPAPQLSGVAAAVSGRRPATSRAMREPEMPPVDDRRPAHPPPVQEPPLRAGDRPLGVVRPRTARDVSIFWLGPLYDQTSAAIHGRELCAALARQGAGVRVMPPLGPDVEWMHTAGDLAALRLFESTPLLNGFTAVMPFPAAPAAPTSALGRAWTAAGRRCLQVTEYATPPRIRPMPQLDKADELWVPSDFHRTLLRTQGRDELPISVIPPGVDTQHFCPDRPPLFVEGAHGFVCLGVLPWRAERGWDVLLRAYLAEFASTEDTTLVIYTAAASGVTTDELLAGSLELLPELDGDHDCADVVIVREPLSPADYPGLFTSADVLVAPDRTAFDGRLLLEALATGLPVITTAWAATRELVSDEVGAGIRATLAADGLSAEPSLDDLRRLLRQAAASSTWSTARQPRARDLALEHWTIEQEAAAIIAQLR